MMCYRAPSAVELHRMLTIEQVAELTTLSPDSIKRHHADKFDSSGRAVRASRLGDALRDRHTHGGDLRQPPRRGANRRWGDHH